MSDSTTTDDTQQAPPAAPDTAAELATAKAQLAEFAAWKTKIEGEAEETKRASMSEAQKLAADREALSTKEKALRDRSRKEALAKLGVLDKAHQWAPDVDPADPAGAKALEDWAKANPELVKAAPVTSHVYDAPPKSALAKILSGEVTNPLLSAKWAAKLLGGTNGN